MLLLSSNIQHKHSHFERGRSRQPIRVKLWRHGMCAQTITDLQLLRTVLAHGKYNYRMMNLIVFDYIANCNCRLRCFDFFSFSRHCTF